MTERPLLNDESVYPDETVLAQCLGKAKKAFDGLMDMIRVRHPDCAVEWRYYRDGKAWLCKTVRKKKTICWVSVWDGFFRITFYFTGGYDEEIKKLAIDASLKKTYAASGSPGKNKAMTILVTAPKQLRDIETLFAFKEKLK